MKIANYNDVSKKVKKVLDRNMGMKYDKLADLREREARKVVSSVFLEN